MISRNHIRLGNPRQRRALARRISRARLETRRVIQRLLIPARPAVG